MARTGGSQRNPEIRRQTLERERQILELRLRGSTYAEIAGAMGMSEVGVWKAYIRAMQRVPEKVARVARKESLERLDRMRNKLWTRIMRPDASEKAVGFYVETLIKLEAREARLLGLDAPQKLDPNANVNAGGDRRLTDLAAMIRMMPDEDRAAFLLLLQRAKQRQVENAGTGDSKPSGD